MKVAEAHHGGRTASDRRALGRPIMAVIAVLLVALSLPVLLRGAPLADDFSKCLEPQQIGVASSLRSSFDRLGVIRPAHVLEILLTTGVCQHLPFGWAIAVPLLLTLLVAVLVWGLLKDAGLHPPWPELGAATWLLQPLGTESALWPAALHIPLGLSLAVAAVRLHRAARHGWGTVTAVGALLSVEQVILALPFAVWLMTPPERRRAALGSTIPAVVAVLAAFILWPGEDPRLQATLVDRLAGLADDPAFYIQFPAVGMGLHSIPLAVLWAFPLGLVVLAAGGLVGARLGPLVLPTTDRTIDRRSVRPALLAGIVLILLVNIPVILAIPRQGSPRLFTPTWLIISAVLPFVVSEISFKRRTLTGAVAGLLAAGAILSLALSVHVRLRSAAFSESASRRIAEQVQDGDVVAVCGVRRAVVDPAPRGAFAVHELVYDWAAADALQYYTGRQATFILSGEMWERPCPDRDTVDEIISFPALLEETTR
jgi:hypothetical protein